MQSGNRLARSDIVFIALCVIAYAAATLLIPPYIPLIEPDSESYINFWPLRSSLYPGFLFVFHAIGLDLVEITWVQIGIFSVALAYLLAVLLKTGVPRVLLGVFVAVLAENTLFSSFHRSILTESLYFSLSVVLIGLWVDYFRTRKLFYIALAGLVLGLMIGFRPAGIGIIPMQLLAAWLTRPTSLRKWVLLTVALVPVIIGAGSERLLYRLVHHSASQTTAPLLLMGKAAMLIEPTMRFSGPHVHELQSIGSKMTAMYSRIQKILADAPSISVRVQLSAAYESLAQDKGFLFSEIRDAAQRAGISVDELRSELGKQVILQNLSGFLKLTIINEIGQWSVDAQHFPPTARRIAAYADAQPGVSLGGVLPPALLHPVPSMAAFVIYPSFLAIGAVTLLLAVGIAVFIARPQFLNSQVGFYLAIATFMSALCHAYTLFISLANVWTPRFLMAIFPHLGVVALCLIMATVYRRKKARLSESDQPAVLR